MREWEQAWLAYQPVAAYKDKKYFETIYTEETGIYIEHALEECSRASESLFGFRTKTVPGLF